MENESPKMIEIKCEHEHFKVLGENAVGYGQCLDCNKEINLSDLFNGLIERCESFRKVEKDDGK